MDFFNDPNLFVGVLDGLEDESFPPAPSLVDELNLSADFEPLQMDHLGPGKPDTLLSGSTQQAIPAYNEQMGHYIGAKAQTPVGPVFPTRASSGVGGGGPGMSGSQHSQYCNANAMGQVRQTNGLFCNSSSPMWGNQDQNGSVYHHLPQHTQQLHNHQLHTRQQTQQQQEQHQVCQQQQEQHHKMQQQLQQQHSHHLHHQQQLLNQHQHQQINTQTVPIQHHGYPFHQREGRVQSQQQAYHPLPRAGQGFHARPLPNKAYLDIQNASLNSRPCLQAQQQQRGGNYQMSGGGRAFSGSGPEPSNLLFPMHSSTIVHPMVSCSVNHRPVSQYPAYPGDSETPGLSEQPLSSANNIVPPLSSTLEELSGTLCPFQSTETIDQQHLRTLGQASEYTFQGLPCPKGTQANCKSSDMFGKSMNCYSGMAGQQPSEQPRQNCGATNTNGYPALEDHLLPSDTQDGDLEDLEPSDLLPDLLPQLEATLSQQDESNSNSWADSSHGIGHEHSKASLVGYEDEKVNHYFFILHILCVIICNFVTTTVPQFPMDSHLEGGLERHTGCPLKILFC